MDVKETVTNYRDDKDTSITYRTHFDPQIFLEEKFGDDSLTQFGIQKCILDALNDVFGGGLISGKRLLDVGTGPTFYTIIAASRHFDDIYLSDLLPQNLSFLREWWIKDVPLIEPALKYCLDLEHSRMTVSEKSTEIKLKVKGILSIDVIARNPLAPDRLAPFDAITVGFCFESASTSHEEYKEAVSNVATLLKKNGKLIILGALNETFFRIGNVKFPNISISESDIRQIYTDMGFQIEKFQNLQFQLKPNMRDDDASSYIMVVKKMIE